MEEKYYRIGEVAALLNLKTHVLRFWETEFPQIEPLRTESGQRLYSESDVGAIRRIQQLLHEQGMTIEGARRVLSGADGDDCGFRDAGLDQEFIARLESELAAICELLRQGSQP